MEKNKIRRKFVPGSEWLYIKIYTGVKTGEKLLLIEIKEIIIDLKKKGMIEKWFFIRYEDPAFHLRLRFLVKDTLFVGSILSMFNVQLNFYIKNHIIDKIQIDTYNRELERYHPHLITFAESIFYIDSECTLELLMKINSHVNEDIRLVSSLLLTDHLLSCCNFSIENKLSFLNKLHEGFKNEFGFNKYNMKQFNLKYRLFKEIIEKAFNSDNIEFSFIYSLISEKSSRINPLIKSLEEELENLNVGIDTLLGSYIHMMINRLFLSKNRLYELVTYDFLIRYYSSRIVREKAINIRK